MTRKSKVLCSVAVSIALISAAAAQPAPQGGKKFNVELSGEAEVTAEGVPNQGDLPATGTATITVNPGQSRVCWEITTANLAAGTTTISGAHIHIAPATSTGPVVLPLTASINDTSSGCSEVTRELADAIRKSPENYYVNVHTNLFPAGALRGQLG